MFLLQPQLWEHTNLTPFRGTKWYMGTYSYFVFTIYTRLAYGNTSIVLSTGQMKAPLPTFVSKQTNRNHSAEIKFIPVSSI